MASDEDYAAIAYAHGDRSPLVKRLAEEGMHRDFKLTKNEHVWRLAKTLAEEDPSLSEFDAKRRAENILSMACCDKARSINCVCAYSFICPEHGERHIGSHD